MKLQELRQARLWSRAELAARAGVAYSTISEIERGTRPRRIEVVRKIAAALSIAPQHVDEFQPVAGTPEVLAGQISEEDRRAIWAAIEEADREGWIDEAEWEEFKRDLSREGQSAAA